MNADQKIRSFSPRESESKSSQVEYISFSDVIAAAADQLEADSFPPELQEQVREVCLIVAEILYLPAACMIRIAGINMPAEAVQTIYRQLTSEHVKHVLSNYARVTYEIKHKKTYLRTALYNSVFELQAHYTNAVAKDMPQLVSAPFGRNTVCR